MLPARPQLMSGGWEGEVEKRLTLKHIKLPTPLTNQGGFKRLTDGDVP